MFAFFFGFIFLFLDYGIPVGGGTLQLIPAFLGYILIAVGAWGLEKKISGFRKIRNFSAVLIFWSVATFFLDIFAPLEEMKYISLSIGLLSTVFALYITHMFASAIRKAEGRIGLSLNGEKLLSGWALLTLTAVLSYAGMFFEDLILPCLILRVASTFWFLTSVLKCAVSYKKRHI